MKLLYSVTSPYARKARAVAIEKRIDLELELVSAPFVGVATHNPLGKIPVLLRDDGSAVFDSPVIIELLDGLGQGPSLLGEGAPRIAVNVWQALADGIMDATVARTMELRRPTTQQSNAVIEHQEGKVVRALAFAETRVEGDCLVDQRFTLADIALCAAIGYLDLRYPHDWRASHPRLAAFAERVDARPCLAETRPVAER